MRQGFQTIKRQSRRLLSLPMEKIVHTGIKSTGDKKMNDEQFNAQIARDILAKSDEYVILDTETTGLLPCEIVQLAIIDLEGKTLFNSLVKPKCKISEGAIAIHGINEDAVANAPSFYEIYPQVAQILLDKVVLIYNARFDTRVLEHCCDLDNLKFPDCSTFCVMQIYSEWHGEWNSYHNSYKWQKLPGGDHTALGDCLATLTILKQMAATPERDIVHEIDNSDEDIPY